MLKHAVILAGGKGTRLKEVSDSIPKPMMPVAGKPLLEYQIELCKKYGIQEVTLIVNHLKDSIINYFGNGQKWNIAIKYFEETTPLGTVGGIKEIENKLTDDFLVLYGDVIIDMDLNRLYQFHLQHKSDATLVVHPNDHPYDSDLVETDENNRVTHFHSKPHPEGVMFHNLVNAAAYVFSPNVLPQLQKGVKADFGKDIFPNILDKLNVFAYSTSEYLKDMGTPGRLEKVSRDVLSGKVAGRSLEKKQKAIFLDRDGVLNYDTDLIHRTQDFTLYDYTAEAVKKINASGYLAIVITNQSIIARGLTDIKGLGEIHKKMEWQLGEAGAFLDDIYYCPHHPHGGFEGEVKAYKIDCECRKPKPGMILQAAKKFNIDLSQSFMIGDSERDAGAGKAAGVTTIGVKTGHGLKNTNIFPDYFFSNLVEAVDFILDNPHKAKFEAVKTEFEKKTKKPFVINIGGNTRSGKSTLATYLQKNFEKAGKTVLQISLDDWILPKAERVAEVDVFHNFQTPKLETELLKILNGETVKVEGYARHPKRKATAKTYQYKNQEIVIVEGIIALSTEKLRALADLKIFKTISEEELHSRLKTYYHWKEYSETEFASLYAKRKKDEYKLIEKDEQWADLVF